MFNNKNSICVCKGIRKCVLCAPESVTKELNGEKDFLFKSNNLFFYCSKCDQSVKVDQLLGKILTDYLDQKITKIPCMCQNRDQNEILKISGIFLQENFISYDEEQFLLSAIDKSKWVESQSGRFKQDFGPKANFKHKKLKCSTFTGLPVYSKFLIQRLQNSSNEKVKTFVPVELCNLRYESSRGACIDPHFDDFWLWGERLITFNLLENTFLTLTPGKEVNESFGDHQVLVPLSRFSMIVLTDDARFKWMHGIKKSHIKNCRQAITIRELTNEFKNAENQGDFLEKLALTFKGISVGTIEDFFNDKNKTENWPHRLCLCDHDLGKVDSYWEKFANLLKNESNNKEFYYNIGKKLAEWTNECQQSSKFLSIFLFNTGSNEGLEPFGHALGVSSLIAKSNRISEYWFI
ncbi:alpha-ketoglutarate-dependent dioxygenase alkB -like protein [Brachionus plicatilis]|uniref:Alpha-ketoglutarate-dependent dioxygenase alkB-like protein n=1 Tax=Brachionus plicatilis TaxID=10195 RepID=A0A3M7QHZ4_BRAPC|nr:alpha-ketoglutarate-dependent dioxygenase alkB -like protein [Brachionus plicatilis]